MPVEIERMLKRKCEKLETTSNIKKGWKKYKDKAKHHGLEMNCLL